MRLLRRGQSALAGDTAGLGTAEPPAVDDLDLPAFDWPSQGGGEPPPDPPSPSSPPPRRKRPRLRRRRAWGAWRRLPAWPAWRRLRAWPRWRGWGTARHRRLAAAAVLLAAAAGLAAGLIVGGGGERPLSARDKAQLEAAAPGSSKAGHDASLPVAPRVARAAAALPLPRAVSQLFVVGTPAPRSPFRGRLRGRDWGGVVLAPGDVSGPGEARSLVRALRTTARRARHLPPLVAAHQPGGPSSALPGLPPRAQPLAGDRDARAARADATLGARALRRLGVSMAIAPVADVGVAAGPVQDQVFSDDARAVARLTAAAVDGWRRGGVIPVVGHFPGQGGASEDPDVANATVGLGLSDLRRRDLRPFAAVAGSAPVMMMSNAVYAAWDGVTPAALLPEAIRLLRRDLRFRGVVMTPDLVSTAPVYGVGVGTAAVKALEAGADLLYVSGGRGAQEAAYRAVLTAVREKRISRERLRLSLQRVLALKRSVGLLPEPRGRARSRRPASAAPAPGPAIRARGTVHAGR